MPLGDGRTAEQVGTALALIGPSTVFTSEVTTLLVGLIEGCGWPTAMKWASKKTTAKYAPFISSKQDETCLCWSECTAYSPSATGLAESPMKKCVFDGSLQHFRIGWGAVRVSKGRSK